MTAIIEEHAAAKINLTLRVLGRRPDGYHEIESLVVFADYGDRLTLHRGQPSPLHVTGPFAPAIDGPNLIDAAVWQAVKAVPDLALGAFVLEKNLPVAAGLGGGSADAAAALRAIRRANLGRAEHVDWHKLATDLGADVPVCLASKPALMGGIGERLQPVADIPRMSMVLANPGLPLATREVFQALRAEPAPRESAEPSPPPAFKDGGALCDYLLAHGNDLEPPAIALCPAVARVKDALAAAPGALLARMSGSGPTCFALFARDADAIAAADMIRRAQPDWWVVPTRTI